MVNQPITKIWFFTLYDKDEAADLTTEEKKVLKKAIHAEFEARRRKTWNTNASCSMN